jgi:predicted Rdx family selenoprotein
MANEFFRAFGGDAAISLTPGSNGRLEVRLDDELIFDKKSEDNKFPDLGRVREMKKVVAEKLESLATAAAD